MPAECFPFTRNIDDFKSRIYPSTFNLWFFLISFPVCFFSFHFFIVIPLFSLTVQPSVERIPSWNTCYVLKLCSGIVFQKNSHDKIKMESYLLEISDKFLKIVRTDFKQFIILILKFTWTFSWNLQIPWNFYSVWQVSI